MEQGSCAWFLRNTTSKPQETFTQVYRRPQASDIWLKPGFAGVDKLITFTQLQIVDTEQKPQLTFYYQDGNSHIALGTQAPGVVKQTITAEMLKHLKKGSDKAYVGLYSSVSGQVRVTRMNLNYTDG